MKHEHIIGGDLEVTEKVLTSKHIILSLLILTALRQTAEIHHDLEISLL